MFYVPAIQVANLEIMTGSDQKREGWHRLRCIEMWQIPSLQKWWLHFENFFVRYGMDQNAIQHFLFFFNWGVNWKLFYQLSYVYLTDLFGSHPRLQNFSCYFICNSFTFFFPRIYTQYKLAGKFILIVKNRLYRTEFNMVGRKPATDRLDWTCQYWWYWGIVLQSFL